MAKFDFAKCIGVTVQTAFRRIIESDNFDRGDYHRFAKLKEAIDDIDESCSHGDLAVLLCCSFINDQARDNNTVLVAGRNSRVSLFTGETMSVALDAAHVAHDIG